ncbi:SDR family NAD(P)-dependent oxidoreductase [Solicola sp. PLA-1-18]|uniref:SDR family NAD(P)-dependent oxidoreductase n=1 Tax=Solicola sp. PLA-1-18 TaxID=3380532 RepID=UPI003B79AA7F
MADVNGRTVLVTGATGGLGSLLARGLAEAGARVVVSARDEGRLGELGVDGAVVLAADLTLPGAPEDLVARTVEATGSLDGVVHAAGVVAFGPASEVDDDVVDELLLLNYLAPLRLVRAASPHLPEGGFVAAISAVVAERPMPQMAAYSASKAALSAYLTSIRTELRRRKVRVLDVRPPHTETGLATRPVAGEAPKMPTGLSPDAVAARILAAITDDETDLASDAF